MPEWTSQVRVRYVETDQMGVVHHASYLAWMEVARTEYLRSRGLPYRELEEMGIRMPVLEVAAKYMAPAKYDEEILLKAELAAATGVRFRFDYEIRRMQDGALLCEGHTEHAATDLSGRPRRVPREVLDRIGGGREKG